MGEVASVKKQLELFLETLVTRQGHNASTAIRFSYQAAGWFVLMFYLSNQEHYQFPVKSIRQIFNHYPALS